MSRAVHDRAGTADFTTLPPDFCVADWVVEPSLDRLSRGAVSHKLEPRTMRLLLCLCAFAGEVVSMERLLKDVWGGVIVSRASVYQSVSQLRKRLGDTDPNPTFIATVARKGYRLLAAVTPRNAPASAHGPARAAPVPSIAVLPFVDMTENSQGQFFCDGLTEELSAWLAQIPTLKVVARTSACAFRGQQQDARKIGQALATDHLLEGSLRRSGDHMRVTVQLIDARDGYHLWSARYDRYLNDAIEMQEDIARSVAQALELRFLNRVVARTRATAGAWPAHASLSQSDAGTAHLGG